MKGALFLLLTFLLIGPCSEAQVYVGPMVGGQLSWTQFDDNDLRNSYGVKPVLGYHAGVNVSLKVRNRFFLHTSILYATKGRKIEGKTDPLLANRARYDFIEMPVIYAVDFRGRLGSGKEFKYYLGIGPNVSYWLGGKGELYNSDLDESADFASRDLEYSIVFRREPDDFSPNEMNVASPNRIQLGLNLATGIVLEPQPNQRILLLLRYEMGHSFLAREGNGTFTPTYYQDVLKARNKGIRISASYLLDLKIEKRKKGKSTIKKNKR